jgi:homocysteine S-methyltransferase
LQPFLERSGVVILDGGLATELERRGADLRDPLWSAKMLAENPALIREVHEDYFRAGADVGTSASYQASFLGFVRRGLPPREAAELMRLSVRLVQEARDRVGGDRLVAASIGCYGAFLADGGEYRGDYDLTADELVDWHRPRLETLLDAKPDLLACETIPCLVEAEALARLLGEYPQTPAWISFSCRDEARLRSGESFEQAIRIASTPANIVGVGVNCSAPRFIEPLLRVASRVTDKILVSYPNSGEGWDAERKCWIAERETLDWAAAAKSWHAAGARLIGGCCRTTPETIRLLRSTFPAA